MPAEIATLKTGRGTLSRQEIYDLLRAEIIANALPPGRPIPEAQMAQRYGAGRSPLREALMRLAGEGLVRIIPQVGTFVAPLDLADIGQAHSVRSLLECAAAQACADTGGELAPRLDLIIAMQRVALQGEDFDALLRLDGEFHERIAVAGLGAMAWRVISQMRGHYLRVRNLLVPDPSNRSASVEHHARIAAAIAAGDADGAAAAMQQHMHANHAQLVHLRDRHPEFFADDAQPSFPNARSP